MISLTERGARHVAEQLAERGGGLGIRVGVRVAGCSGLAYVLEFVDEAQADDLVFESHGVRVYCALEHHLYLDGTVMDYVTQGLNSGFEFDNPNKKGECGCGESFIV